ncbi:ABC-type multidrug transport system, ATPase component [Rubritalea squalenifaciens DSM 18772]|uniref:ABC-type multidrug transport system, ATPase component n=1 Tax=Rubritalea squalenifaciens DSM 18772 TaxID=1123071 RepID=A0A1M6M9W6_9BACT|nr:ATP-binding cassette domain-containing protein [Rubritalea squalenifaciens]SHJ80209.1 ABC-type multidrug transport system, ATPase component [Rubritalea squalenifaciens DSM 18772]
MLEIKDLCFTIEKDDEPLNLVDRVSINIPSGHFMAIVGPSGCGKTTLLNTLAGLNELSEGAIYWNGRDLEEDGDFDPAELGYVPQFSIAYDELTVDESIEAVTKLRVRTRNLDDLDLRIDRVLEETGLTSIADRYVKVLSGGQKRRLGLAMELVTDPKLLLCDEVTSGLDPRSERDIVRRLHSLSRRDGRIVISVTHSLAHLELYDSILVLHEGRVAYHGPPNGLTHYFSVEDTEEIYPRLAKQDASKWQKSWLKHKDVYYKKIDSTRQRLIDEGQLIIPETKELDTPSKESKKSTQDIVLDETGPLEDDRTKSEISSDTEFDEFGDIPIKKTGKVRARKPQKIEDSAPLEVETEKFLDSSEIVSEGAEPISTPNFASQFSTLLARRWKIFFRDKGQVILQLAILICFPCLVALFGEQASAPLLQYPDVPDVEVSMQSMKNLETIGENRAKVGGAVSGIIMFQVVLLALMGSNNAAREIAGERKIMEKEKFGGVSPFAYLLSKIVFLSGMVIIQSVWMAIFVEQFWHFPENHATNGFFDHVLFLILVNAAMTSICLGISSLMKTSEQASLLSIYLVGFQLPLSGAVLALPEFVGQITRPFISAYWAWSGSIESLEDRYQAAITTVTTTPLDNTRMICLYVLGFQILIGLIASYIGIRRHQWEH